MATQPTVTYPHRSSQIHIITSTGKLVHTFGGPKAEEIARAHFEKHFSKYEGWKITLVTCVHEDITNA